MRVLHNCEIFRNFAGDLVKESDQCCGSRRGNRYEKNDSITAVAAVGAVLDSQLCKAGALHPFKRVEPVGA